MISQELRQLKRQAKKINKMELVLKKLIYGEEYYSHIIVKMMDYDDALAKKSENMTTCYLKCIDIFNYCMRKLKSLKQRIVKMISKILESIADRRMSKLERKLALLQEQLSANAIEQKEIKETLKDLWDFVQCIESSCDTKLQLIYHDQEIMFDDLHEIFQT